MWDYKDRWCAAYDDLVEEYKESYPGILDKKLHNTVMKDMEDFLNDEYYIDLDG